MYGINNFLVEYKRNDYSGHLSDFPCKIDCSLGTNPYGRWSNLKMNQEIFEQIELYPHRSESLLEGISKYFSNVANIKPENISLACGSIAAIMAVNRMFLKPGKRIVGIAPQFSAVIDDFNIYEVEYLPVYLREENNYQFILEDFLSELIKVKDAYIYIDNPNNPTGQIIPKKDLEKIIIESQKRNSFVVIDEAYGDYMDLNNSVVDLLDQYDNFVVIRSFSKGFGAAGIRLGYVIGSKEFINLFNKVNIPFSNNTIADYIASQIINSGWDKENRHKINQGKRRVLNELSILKVGYTSVNIPISMIYCDNKSIDLCKLMEKVGLKVVSCEGYDGLDKNSIRLNLHADMELLMECLKEAEELLEKGVIV